MMKKIVLGILVSMMMVGSVIAASTSVNNLELNENLTLFEDGEIVTSIPVGSYEIESTDSNSVGRAVCVLEALLERGWRGTRADEHAGSETAGSPPAPGTTFATAAADRWCPSGICQMTPRLSVLSRALP